MFYFTILIYLFICVLCSLVLLCQHRYSRIPFVMLAVLFPTVTWYVYSPVHRGHISLMKSVDRASMHDGEIRNWADTVLCRPQHLLKPTSLTKLSNIVSSAKSIRVVAGGHSWSPLVCSDDTVISLENMCHTPIFHNDSTVTFDAGCTIQETHKWLLKRRRQLHGYGAIQHQTLAGGFMTALHGSQFDNFASHVTKLEAVLANGTVVRVNDSMDAWRGSMGLLGIVTKMTFQTYPSKSVRVIEKSATLRETLLAMNNDSLIAADAKTIWGRTEDVYHLRTFTEPIEKQISLSHDKTFEAYLHDNVFMPSLLLASRLLHRLPIAQWYYPEYASYRQSIMDAWYTYPEFGFKNAAYSIPYDHCFDAITEIRNIARPYLVTVELRRLVHAPGLLTWVSTPSCIFDVSFVDAQLSKTFDKTMKHFHLQIEDIIHEYGGAAHWGKFYASNFSKMNIPGLESFKTLRTQYDPNGKFLNDMTAEIMLQQTMKERYPPSAIQTRGLAWRFTFYAAIAFIFMLWVWPYQRYRKGGYMLTTTEDPEL